MHTFQTVKLTLETWAIIDKLSREESLTISEALERLVRHGSIRYAEVQKRLDE